MCIDMFEIATRHRYLSILIHVEVSVDAHPCRDGRVLLTAGLLAALGGDRRADRAVAQSHRRPGPPTTPVTGRGPRWWRSLCVRPQRRLRPVAADHQPPPQGAARVGPARSHQAWGVGLLPRPLRGSHRPRRTDRRRPVTRKLVAELTGTAFLVMAVIGSGIAASRLSPDDVGLQLLENSLIT